MRLSEERSNCLSKIVQKTKFVKDILQLIQKKQGKALLVGGAVRDLLLQRQFYDLDFEVYGLQLDEIEKILSQFGVVSLVGKSFGVLRLHGLDIDWSLPRKDSSGRHPQVSYDPFMSYEDAFARRDVTINAMGIDMQTYELIDPFHGLQDLNNKVLRSAHLDFFTQDPLRLFRVMQFVGRLEMTVDDALSQHCKTMNIDGVSIERIQQEFTKLFTLSKKPSLGLVWLQDINLFGDFFFSVVDTNKLLFQIDQVGCRNDDAHDKLLFVYALVVYHCDFMQHVDDAEVGKVPASLKKRAVEFMKQHSFHKKLIDQIVLVAWYSKVMVENQISVTDLKWIAAWIDSSISIEKITVMLQLLGYVKHAQLIADQALKNNLFLQKELPVLTGKDFIDVAKGSQIGLLVAKSYELQLNENIHSSKQLFQKVMQYHKSDKKS